MQKLPLWKDPDFRKVDKIYLLLGPQCNMVCRHCSQTPIKGCVSLNTKMDDKVWTMLDNYAASAIRDNKVKNIQFWGGETLLHWNLIVKLIVYLTEKYNLLEHRMVRFSITSNGLLLTQDKVDFLNKYGIYFTFSYDAPQPWAVRGYVSDEICTLVNKIDHCTILSSYNAINYDTLLTFKCLSAKFPKANIVCGHSLIYSFDMPKDIYTYDWDKIRCAFRKICIAAYKEYPFAVGYLKHLALRLLYNNEAHERFINEAIPICMAMDVLFSVTIDGNISVCHNSDCYLGTVDDPFDVLYEKAKQHVQAVRNPLCPTCRHKDFCCTNCIVNMRDKSGAYYNCTKFLIPFLDIAKEEMAKLYNGYSEEELLWYDVQCKNDDVLVSKFLSDKNFVKGGSHYAGKGS